MLEVCGCHDRLPLFWSLDLYIIVTSCKLCMNLLWSLWIHICGPYYLRSYVTNQYRNLDSSTVELFDNGGFLCHNLQILSHVTILTKLYLTISLSQGSQYATTYFSFRFLSIFLIRRTTASYFFHPYLVFIATVVLVVIRECESL